MKIILVVFLFYISFLNADILSDKIQAKMNQLCYYKSFIDGSNDGTIPQSSYWGTESSRQLKQTITDHAYNSSIYTCDEWSIDPYVNMDTEVYSVVANTSCSTRSETIDSSSSATYYRDIEQYNISVNCSDSSCELPKDSSGNVYEKNTQISDSECNVDTLNRLYKGANDVYMFKIIDAQYVSCDASPTDTGCYYKLGLNDSNPDNNSTNPSDGNVNGGSGSGGTSNNIDKSVSDLKEQLDNDNATRRRQLDRIIKETNMTAYLTGLNVLTLHDINRSLNNMNTYMRSGLDNTDVTDIFSKAIDEANSTASGITSILKSLNITIASFSHTVPIVTGTGTSIFTANVYGSSIVFDFSMIQNLRQYFDILWILLLAYFNFKIYVMIIRDLIKKI